MALMRGFSKVDENGRITIPDDIARFTGLYPGSIVNMIVSRNKGTARFPHYVIHRPRNIPYISMLEAIMKRAQTEVNEQVGLTLSDEIMQEIGVKPGYLMEFKIHEAKGQRWIVVHNRGPWRQTTLQERMGHKKVSKWRKVEVNY
jgi:bifunctional DNA-binding transcriptional regulator/antitoxin component of YhaV-PrlF toxin-antitoxin module